MIVQCDNDHVHSFISDYMPKFCATMRHDLTMQLLLYMQQSLDMMVDLLERKYRCLADIALIRTFSLVVLLTANQSLMTTSRWHPQHQRRTDMTVT